MVEEKKCTRCKKIKSFSEFYKSKRSKDGMYPHCKSCSKILSREYYEKNRQTIIDKQKVYQKENFSILSEKQKKRRIENHDYIIQKEKEYRKDKKEYRAKKSREYYHKNKDKIRERRNKYEKERIKTDPNFKLRKALRRRISNALKKRKTFKKGSSVSLIGCSIPEARAYLEKQFKPGMRWDNHGEWEIDHKRPCASFDLTDIKQQKKCFHYTNMQPLWSHENKLKGDKIINE